MKVLFFPAALANVVLFMWEFRQGAFERDVKISQQPLRERVLLVNELKHEVANVDFRSLFPPGLDPPADNLLTVQPVLANF